MNFIIIITVIPSTSGSGEHPRCQARQESSSFWHPFLIQHSGSLAKSQAGALPTPCQHHPASAEAMGFSTGLRKFPRRTARFTHQKKITQGWQTALHLWGRPLLHKACMAPRGTQTVMYALADTTAGPPLAIISGDKWLWWCHGAMHSQQRTHWNSAANWWLI